MKLTVVFFLLACNLTFAQDTSLVRRVVAELTSDKMAGRGYVENGDAKAARYIASQFKKAGLKKVEGSYMQPFTFQVNSFPGCVEVTLSGKTLRPGYDYIVSPGSPSMHGKFSVVVVNQHILSDSSRVNEFLKGRYADKFVLLDDRGMSDEEKTFFRKLQSNPFGAAGLIILKEKLTWSVSQEQGDHPVIEILYDAWLGGEEVSVCIDARLKMHKTSNVLGYAPGSVRADSFIVFTAHYDHLGKMGREAVFPGANDNASGVAMLIDLAQHYVKNPHRYSVLFIAFAGEEAGLIGSHHFVQQPMVPLRSMAVLLNLDLMGNGSEGIMVVNGAVFEKEFQLLNEINKREQLLTAVNKRGKAANSDHYFFTEAGVTSFFIYTLGGSKAYHDVYDTPEVVGFDEYQDIFRLLTTFSTEGFQ